MRYVVLLLVLLFGLVPSAQAQQQMVVVVDAAATTLLRERGQRVELPSPGNPDLVVSSGRWSVRAGGRTTEQVRLVVAGGTTVMLVSKNTDGTTQVCIVPEREEAGPPPKCTQKF